MTTTYTIGTGPGTRAPSTTFETSATEFRRWVRVYDDTADMAREYEHVGRWGAANHQWHLAHQAAACAEHHARVCHWWADNYRPDRAMPWDSITADAAREAWQQNADLYAEELDWLAGRRHTVDHPHTIGHPVDYVLQNSADARAVAADARRRWADQ